MNDAETIKAAIEKLEQQKADSTPGPWDFEYTDESIEINAGTARTQWNETNTVGRPAGSWKTTDRIMEVDCFDLDENEADLIAGNAELIVTLHSTIEPILAILRLELAALHPTASAFPMTVHATALDLARAILGVSS